MSSWTLQRHDQRELVHAVPAWVLQPSCRGKFLLALPSRDIRGDRGSCIWRRVHKLHGRIIQPSDRLAVERIMPAMPAWNVWCEGRRNSGVGVRDVCSGQLHDVCRSSCVRCV